MGNGTTPTTENASWWDEVVNSFKEQWWVFAVVLGIVLVVMLIVCIASKGKIFKPKTIIKVAIHCIMGFVLLFVLNFFGALFTSGSWALTPKWYSWIIIGIFGILGVIFLLISSFVWPGVLVM